MHQEPGRIRRVDTTLAPGVTKEGIRLQLGSAAQEGIARGSNQRGQGAERKAQQGAATDASAVGDDISEFHGAAGREVLAGFEQSSEDEHRKAHYDSSAFVPESDHWQK